MANPRPTSTVGNCLIAGAFLAAVMVAACSGNSNALRAVDSGLGGESASGGATQGGTSSAGTTSQVGGSAGSTGSNIGGTTNPAGGNATSGQLGGAAGATTSGGTVGNTGQSSTGAGGIAAGGSAAIGGGGNGGTLVAGGATASGTITGGNIATGGVNTAATAVGGQNAGGSSATGGVNAGGITATAGANTGGASTGGVTGPSCSSEGQITCVGHASSSRQRCSGSVLVSYDACPGGELCDTASANGSCAPVAPDCQGRAPGDIFCKGQVREVCGPDLVTIQQKDCGSSALCGVGTGADCGVCTTDQHNCAASLLQICNANHTGFDLVKDCGASPCSASAGDCTALVCATAGSLRCTGDNLEICSPDRTAYSVKATCDPGMCDSTNLTCDKCLPSTVSCANLTQYSQCSTDGQISTVKDCPAGTGHCVGNGTCVACTPQTQATDCLSPNDCNDAYCNVGAGNVCQLAQHGFNTVCHTAGTEGNLTGVCNDTGQCVICTASTQCIPADDCHIGSCGSDGNCSFPQKQTDATCNNGHCNSLGVCVPCVLDTECPNATCYNAACVNYECKKTPQTAGTPDPNCSGGDVCDGDGKCVQCTGSGQAQCASGNVCRGNACVTNMQSLGWPNATGSTSTVNGDVMYLKHIPALQYPAVLKTFGIVGTNSGASVKFALYADNGNATTPEPKGAPLALGSALGLPAGGGARETAAVPNTVTLAAGASYWIAIKLNVTLTAANALVAGTGSPPGESVSEGYSSSFETFSGDPIPGSYGTELAIYITVQDTQ